MTRLRAYLPWLTAEDYEKAAADPDPYAKPVSALRRILVETRDLSARSRPPGSTPRASRTSPSSTSRGRTPSATSSRPTRRRARTRSRRRTSSATRACRSATSPRSTACSGDYRKLAEARGAVLMIASDHGFRWKRGRPLDALERRRGDRRHAGIARRGSTCSGARRSRRRPTAATARSARSPPRSWRSSACRRADGVAGPPLPGVEAVHAELADYRAHYKPAPEVQGERGGERGRGRKAPRPRVSGLQGSRGQGDRRHPRGRRTVATRTAGSYNNEGLIRRERGEMEAAVASYEKALTVDPQNASAMWNLSDLLHSQHRDLDRSDDLLLRSLAAGLPEGIDFTVGRTVAYARGGESERALKLLEQALAAKPQDPRLHLLRGRYRLERHQCEKALGDFEAAARSDSKNALAFASVGLARLCIGDGEGAAASFHRSLAINPNQPEIRRALGQIGGRVQRHPCLRPQPRSLSEEREGLSPGIVGSWRTCKAVPWCARTFREPVEFPPRASGKAKRMSTRSQSRSRGG